MLVISHNNDIIRNNSLLFTVVLHIVSLRNIVIDRQHDSILPASHRQFPDKLDIVFSALIRNLLEIYVNTVNTDPQRL